MMWLSKYVLHDKNGKNRMWRSHDNANLHLCEKWFTFLSEWGEKYTPSRKRSVTPSFTAEVHCSRKYYRSNGLARIWMRGHQGTWVLFLGCRHCRFSWTVQCHCLAMWHFLLSLPGYVNVRCWAEHCAIVRNGRLYLWKISWANCWICVRL